MREEVIWTRMEAPTEKVLGQEFEYEGKMVKVVDYDPEGIATLTIEYNMNADDVTDIPLTLIVFIVVFWVIVFGLTFL